MQLRLLRSDLMYSDAFSVPLLLMAAVVIGVAAQSFINQMIEGDQGLGAFLKDGSGYNKSGFRPRSKKKSADSNDDPLPWLKLPTLDYVEVAGQQKANTLNEEVILEQLELLRQNINTAMQEGRVEEAESIRIELEETMKSNNIEYRPNGL